MDLEGRMSFLVEWYDTAASIARQYQLFFYPEDNSVEMFDIKNRKVFLKRTVCQSVTPADLYVGSTVTVYARQLRVVGCGDQATTRTLTSARESTYAMIKPDAYVHIGKILTMIFKAGFTLNNLKMLKLDRATAESFYGEHVGKPFFERLVSFMTEDAVVAMELAGKDAIPKWRGLLGPTNTAVAKEQAPDSIRGRFGTDGTRNAAHGSDSKASAARETGFFFGSDAQSLPTTACFTFCTLCLIKPRAITEGTAGEIIDAILQAGFEISAMRLVRLDLANAQEFLEVYKGVVPEYRAITEMLSSGPVIAMEIRGEDVVNNFRAFCGPADPEIAKALRPTTLRARFGSDKIHNGVHCTDLPEDGVLEVITDPHFHLRFHFFYRIFTFKKNNFCLLS
eukprot:TRINITY_DN3408_c0_g1_i3.p1 TRINITY_DN3408_c0_g1~~TRINITY_DN3408_c0_g1_i3.p1  ORF type:complete len:395 (+),score=73.98 TRINITY_DN3408_c0_g1_i3:116-1300(+)